MNPFQFRQFIIQQERCAFKVGTDSIILGAWAEPPIQGRILDIGTGSGVLALMMAQKTTTWAQITGIDRDQGSFDQARENAKNSPWANRIEIIHQSLQDLGQSSSSEFDYIISNPPYFNTQTLSTDPSVAQARNTIHLKFEELIRGVMRLLKTNGFFCMILPTAEAIEFAEMAWHSGLVLQKRCSVFSTTQSASAKRHLMLFEKTDASESLNLKPVEDSQLIIETDQRHHYTDEFKRLTGEFYLEFKN